MRPSLLAVFLVTVAVPTISIAAQTSLIGHEVPPLPVGCESREAMLLGASDAFAYARLICNGSEIVLLQRFKDRRGRQAYWGVIDQLQLPTKTSKSYALTAPLCSSKNYSNEPILAVGRWSHRKDGSFLPRIFHMRGVSISLKGEWRQFLQGTFPARGRKLTKISNIPLQRDAPPAVRLRVPELAR